MDPYQDLMNTARETAQALADKKTPATYTADDGTEIQGWLVETTSSWDKEEHFSRNSFREVWGSNRLILTTDGQFYDYYENREERETGLKHDRCLYLQQSRDLVGSKGKPFSSLKSKLERLPWTV